jgi:hypothetical protein
VKDDDKRYVCTNEGCERSFTRAEHLSRHLLNHSKGDYTCERCRAHFKRRDLLGKDAVSLLWFGEHPDRVGNYLHNLYLYASPPFQTQ